jgi:hypothetical protein
VVHAVRGAAAVTTLVAVLLVVIVLGFYYVLRHLDRIASALERLERMEPQAAHDQDGQGTVRGSSP